MKKLVGGVFLLSLLTLSLVQSVDGETYTSITDKNVLEQLTNLKSYINNPEMIKPVWVQLKNGDDIIVVQGQLSVVDDGEFDIDIAIKGYSLTIHVEFTQVTLSDDTPIDDWYIDTNDAKYLFTSDAQNIGAISDLPVFENIVDKDGHKRFIEGEITIVEQTGVTIDYAKWSLSGSHLLIVVAGMVTTGNTCNLSTSNTSNDIPQWIKDKIYPLGGSDNVAYSVIKNINAQTSQIGSDINIILIKNGNALMFYHESPFGSNDNPVSFRTQFDLLIDNE